MDSWPVKRHGRQRGQMLGGHILLAAETAADQHVLDHDAIRRIVPAEHMQDFAPGVKGALVS